MPEADTEWTIRMGMLTVNLETRVVSVNNKPVHLTGKEYRILELLSRRKGTTVTKEMFLDHLYGGMDEPTGGNHYIETRWAISEASHSQSANKD